MPHVLYTGPSSPFGRMASVVIRETGAPIEEQVVDVYAATFLDTFNPLRQNDLKGDRHWRSLESPQQIRMLAEASRTS